MQSTRLILFVAVLTISRVGRTELILDDFDDAATTTSPAMRNQFVDTLNVGDLDARRSIRIAGLQSEPEGRIDVNAGGNSLFVATLDELNANDSILSKIVAVQVDYDLSTPGIPLSGKDISESGRNNAIIFDFRELSSAVTPRFFRVIAQDLSDSYEASANPLRLSDRPFSVVMPFESFGFRGGGIGLPDFTSIRTFNVELRVITGNGPDDLDFQMILDRIRFAQIPEPACEALIVLGLAVAGCVVRGGDCISANPAR